MTWSARLNMRRSQVSGGAASSDDQRRFDLSSRGLLFRRVGWGLAVRPLSLAPRSTIAGVEIATVKEGCLRCFCGEVVAVASDAGVVVERSCQFDAIFRKIRSRTATVSAPRLIALPARLLGTT